MDANKQRRELTLHLLPYANITGKQIKDLQKKEEEEENKKKEKKKKKKMMMMMKEEEEEEEEKKKKKKKKKKKEKEKEKEKKMKMSRHGSTHLQSQHTAGRDRWVSVSSRPAWSTQQLP
ncbi:hypothetical protein STEG23_019132 [Scotinomys teguina]